ncbi:hypothetical protein SNEBB_000032 [Seison nebaliae]|nr:hypothetical protein SNEBB_000032 [Seison nebaliae]
MYCEIHEEFKDIYCSNCSKEICGKCFLAEGELGKHRQHEKKKLKGIALNLLNEYLKFLLKIEKDHKELLNKISKIQENNNKLFEFLNACAKQLSNKWLRSIEETYTSNQEIFEKIQNSNSNKCQEKRKILEDIEKILKEHNSLMPITNFEELKRNSVTDLECIELKETLNKMKFKYDIPCTYIRTNPHTSATTSSQTLDIEATSTTHSTTLSIITIKKTPIKMSTPILFMGIGVVVVVTTSGICLIRKRMGKTTPNIFRIFP